MAELTSGETQGNIPLEAFDTSSLRHFNVSMMGQATACGLMDNG